MQVIFLPDGSGPRRNIRFRLLFLCTALAAVLLGIAAGGGYLGYRLAAQDAGAPAGPGAVKTAAAVALEPPVAKPLGDHSQEDRKPRPVVDWQAAEADLRALSARTAMDIAADRRAKTRHEAASKFVAAGADKLSALQSDLTAQRMMLEESRRRLQVQLDSLGQRLGQIQAHMSRLNALGQRLTVMADLDPAEFSFDQPPALGGPARRGPWEEVRQPELADSLSMIEIELQRKEAELQVLTALLTGRELHRKQYPQGWPTAGGGWMSSAYGQRADPFSGRQSFHEGVDIAAREGSEVRAMAAGVVSFSGQRPGYGKVVEINHGNGYQTRYAHAKTLTVEAGDRIEKGDTIARVGSTGRSTGSHVHIEVLKNGEAVNPGDYLESSG